MSDSMSSDYASAARERGGDRYSEAELETTMLAPDEILLLKITISNTKNVALIQQCSVARSAGLQKAFSASIRGHLGKEVFTRTNFYRASLMIIIEISAPDVVFIHPNSYEYISDDISNIVRKVFSITPKIGISVDAKIIRRPFDVVSNILSIAAKLFSIFGGDLSPLPSNFDSSGWKPIWGHRTIC